MSRPMEPHSRVAVGLLGTIGGAFIGGLAHRITAAQALQPKHRDAQMALYVP